MIMDTTIQKPSLTPKFFFISLGVIITLITSVVSFLVLFFETLNKKFPDALNSVYQYGYSTYDYESIRSTLATLIIFFPVFLVLSYFWRRLSKNELGVKDNIIFRWMIYLIIFISSLVIVIDLVVLVRYFVSGEITNRFVFKVLGTAVVSYLVGFNYFSELRNHQVENKSKVSIISAIVSLILFVGLIVWSFSIMGSPTKQRAWRLDNQRVTDLQSIQYQVINYWQQKEKLPATLADLSNPISSYAAPVDPEFNKGNLYEYIKGDDKDGLTFQLCATFTANMPKGWSESNYSNYNGPMFSGMDVKTSSSVAYPVGGGVNESWNHEIGRTCFSRTIDKDIYPPYKQ